MILSTTEIITRFESWLAQAKAEPSLKEPTAMALATVGQGGAPCVRMVLLKGVSEKGFDFYTNLESRKAEELVSHPQAALCFYWMPLGKQVRVEGNAELLGEAEADAYFATRSRESRLGAWASDQSRPLDSYATLQRRMEEEITHFEGTDVPRPPHWRGFRIVPSAIEFWQEKPFRLHQREFYTRSAQGWDVQKLYP